MPPRTPEVANAKPQTSLTQTSPIYRTLEGGSLAPLTVTQVNSPYSQSIVYDGTKTAVIKKRVPVAYQTTVEWEKNVYPAVEIAQETIQQPIYIIQEIPNFPLRKTEQPPPPPEPEKPEPVRERARPVRERAAPRPEIIYKDKYNIVEVPREVVKVVERKVEFPVEKVRFESIVTY